MTSPYLEQPFVSLGVALPQMLESIEAELAKEKLEPAHKSHLCRRAELIRELLTFRGRSRREGTLVTNVAAKRS
jgi:hypothetical protein